MTIVACYYLGKNTKSKIKKKEKRKKPKLGIYSFYNHAADEVVSAEEGECNCSHGGIVLS